MPLTLYTTASNYQVYKIQIAAALVGQDLKVEEVKTVHDKSPTKKGPVLDTGAGYIFQSNAIMRYIARLSPASQAYGATVVASGQVDQWIDFCQNELEPARGVWLFPVLKMMELNMRSYNQAKKTVGQALGVLNNHLAHCTYLAGNAPTIADAAIFSALLDMYSTVFAPNFIKKYGNVTRWFTTLANTPTFASVVGIVKFATEEKKAPAPKKKAQPKQQAKKVAAKPAQKKAAKPKNPIDLLPPTSMHLDATKKLFFSDKPFLSTFFDKFWDETFDAAGYCFYTVKYQYDEDNKVFWQTQNQIGMFLQRLDPVRKYAMGCMMLTGATEESAPWKAQGCFMYRGQQVPNEMTPDVVPDTEYYTFTKLDTADPAARALIKSYWQGETVDGEKILDRRYFK